MRIWKIFWIGYLNSLTHHIEYTTEYNDTIVNALCKYTCVYVYQAVLLWDIFINFFGFLYFYITYMWLKA